MRSKVSQLKKKLYAMTDNIMEGMINKYIKDLHRELFVRSQEVIQLK